MKEYMENTNEYGRNVHRTCSGVLLGWLALCNWRGSGKQNGMRINNETYANKTGTNSESIQSSLGSWRTQEYARIAKEHTGIRRNLNENKRTRRKTKKHEGTHRDTKEYEGNVNRTCTRVLLGWLAGWVSATGGALVSRMVDNRNVCEQHTNKIGIETVRPQVLNTR